MRHVPRLLLTALATALLLALLLVFAAWYLTLPTTPDPFYSATYRIPFRPGTLLRQEPFTRGVPEGAVAWRILHATTRDDGSPALASAIVMVARNAPAGPRPVVAWAHGSTGIVRGCAPSLLGDPFAHVPALQPLLDQGWVWVATDYVGLGAAGIHPYLVGTGQARSALDAVRAARQMVGVALSDRTVVWGHSQGGNAALWAGMLAPRYAPDVPLAGIAALAPGSDLPALVAAVQHTPVGRITSAYLLQAYSDTYGDVKFDDYARGWPALMARDIASRCLAGGRAWFTAVEAAAVGGSIFSAPPTSGPLGQRLAENTPVGPWTQPVLIAQGLDDDLVPPAVQSRFVATRCQAGRAIDHRRYAGRDHASLVAADSPLTKDLLMWTQSRFSHQAPHPGCRTTDQ
ncbi:lipase family protein [Rhizobacter sp. OV335]|uniref:lipase family protein n=1 Tax=Rhizobacter sp. OV335 TaxID=1500264 RepID=UPI0009119872|nr:lipase family protein [Rhizobacter sp. OV335]SHN33888.1 Secretory lipase [Rhizobacter sp. OV335]